MHLSPKARKRLQRLKNGLRRARASLLGKPNLPPGVRVGRDVYIGRSVSLDWEHAHLISIEDEAIISEGSRILCHDASSTRRLGVVWVAPTCICRGAFVGTGSLIMPGVTVGAGALVGAHSVVTHDVAPGSIVAGNPARAIGTTAELDARRRELLERMPYFCGGRYLGINLSPERAAELRAASEAHGGYFLVEPRVWDEVCREYPRDG